MTWIKNGNTKEVIHKTETLHTNIMGIRKFLQKIRKKLRSAIILGSLAVSLSGSGNFTLQNNKTEAFAFRDVATLVRKSMEDKPEPSLPSIVWHAVKGVAVYLPQSQLVGAIGRSLIGWYFPATQSYSTVISSGLSGFAAGMSTSEAFLRYAQRSPLGHRCRMPENFCITDPASQLRSKDLQTDIQLLKLNLTHCETQLTISEKYVDEWYSKWANLEKTSAHKLDKESASFTSQIKHTQANLETCQSQLTQMQLSLSHKDWEVDQLRTNSQALVSAQAMRPANSELTSFRTHNSLSVLKDEFLLTQSPVRLVPKNPACGYLGSALVSVSPTEDALVCNSFTSIAQHYSIVTVIPSAASYVGGFVSAMFCTCLGMAYRR